MKFIRISLSEAARVIAFDFAPCDHHRIICEVTRYNGVCLRTGAKLYRSADKVGYIISGYNADESDVDHYILSLKLTLLVLQPEPMPTASARLTVTTTHSWGSTAVLMTEDEYFSSFVAPPPTPEQPKRPAYEITNWSLWEAKEATNKCHPAKSSMVFVCRDRDGSSHNRRFAKRAINRQYRRATRGYIRTFTVQ